MSVDPISSILKGNKMDDLKNSIDLGLIFPHVGIFFWSNSISDYIGDIKIIVKRILDFYDVEYEFYSLSSSGYWLVF